MHKLYGFSYISCIVQYSSGHLAFDSTLILAPNNPEEPFLTPFGPPAVLDSPVILALLGAKSHQQHSMVELIRAGRRAAAAKYRMATGLQDSFSVELECQGSIECNRQRAGRDQFGSNCRGIIWDSAPGLEFGD